jgi:hypothetical protein
VFPGPAQGFSRIKALRSSPATATAGAAMAPGIDGGVFPAGRLHRSPLPPIGL